MLIHYLRNDVVNVLEKYITALRGDPPFHDCPTGYSPNSISTMLVSGLRIAKSSNHYLNVSVSGIFIAVQIAKDQLQELREQWESWNS